MPDRARVNRACATCTFWTPDIEITAITGKTFKVQGVCNGIPTCWDWRLEDGDPLNDKAIMIDANAQLFTAPDFSCALWEKS